MKLSLKEELKALDLSKLTVIEVYVADCKNELRRFEKLPDGEWYLWGFNRKFTPELIWKYLRYTTIKGFGLVM